MHLLKTLPSGPLTWEETEHVLEKAGIEPRYMMTYHTSHTGYAMIAQNLCVGLMEPFASKHWSDEVTLRPFRPRIKLTYALACPFPQVQSKPIRHLCDAIREVSKNWTFSF